MQINFCLFCEIELFAVPSYAGNCSILSVYKSTNLTVFIDYSYVTEVCFLTCCSLNEAHHDHYEQSSGVLLNMVLQAGLPDIS